MRIFFISQRVPFPPDRGDKIATFNQIRHLSRTHEVHVFCTADGLQDIANISDLDRYAKSVTAVPVTPWNSRLRAVKALVLGGPLSVAGYRENQLHASIQEAYARLRPDVLIVYSGNVAQYAEHFPATPRIIQFVDMDSAKWGQYADRSRIPLKWVYRIEQRRLLEYERMIGHSFSRASVCTRSEQRDFERLIPNVPVSVIGNGVDLEYFRSAGHPKKPGSITFTGVMDYLPNVDAVLWFCDEVLPLIQAKVTDASFAICGSRPVKAVQRLARRRGVTVTGRMPDMRPYLDSAEVFVAPLRMARGIQNKVLEALAMGLPCVSSVRAWGGTVIPQGEGILVADHPREFASHIVRLLQDDNYRADMARRGRLAVESNYTWDLQMQALDRVIANVIAGKESVLSG